MSLNHGPQGAALPFTPIAPERGDRCGAPKPAAGRLSEEVQGP